jgi:hypothetical protein
MHLLIHRPTKQESFFFEDSPAGCLLLIFIDKKRTKIFTWLCHETGR